MSNERLKAQRGEYLIGIYERDLLGEGDRNLESQYLIKSILIDLDQFCARKGYNLEKLFETAMKPATQISMEAHP